MVFLKADLFPGQLLVVRYDRALLELAFYIRGTILL